MDFIQSATMNRQSSKMRYIQHFIFNSCLLLSLSACNSSTEPNHTASGQAEQTPPDQQEPSVPQNTAASEAEDSFNSDEVNYEHQNDGFSETAQPLQEQFEVRVRRHESQYSMTGYVDKLNITSLNNDPTTITGVSVNRGNCGTKGFYDYQNMRYGSVAQVYLACSAEYVREVTITTNSGLTYTYNF
jgi:hypothetical protein